MSIVETKTSVPANLDEEAKKMMQETASANPRLIYKKKGKFFIEDADIEFGQKYMAYPREWLRGWLKWKDGRPVEERLGRASEYDPPPREELGDLDKTKWDDQDQDPWQMQNILPLTDLQTDELILFCSGSWGGLKAIKKIVNAYYREIGRGSKRGNPIISLGTYERQTEYGLTPTPKFDIVSWENMETPLPSTKEAMKDELPF